MDETMILLKILDHDLHRSRTGSAIPFMLEIPGRTDFLPAIVSSTRVEKFFVSKRLTDDGRIRTGVFPHSQDTIDSVIPSMISAAYDLSVSEKWNNIFHTPTDCFKAISASSGSKSQPHACLVPSSWKPSVVSKIFGESLSEGRFMKVCRIFPCDVSFPVFLSRPDFVGLYTQLAGGMSSIVLHNVKEGMAFCVPPVVKERSAPARKSRSKAKTSGS